MDDAHAHPHATTGGPPVTAAVGTGSRIHRLRADGVELVLAESPGGLPQVLHWGAPIGTTDADALRAAVGRPISHSGFDERWPLTLLPTDRDGWEGRPGVVVRRGARAFAPRWTETVVEVVDAASVVVRAVDTAHDLDLAITLRLDPAGVLHSTLALRNDGADDLEVVALEAVLPIGDRAREMLDFSGRWTRERAPQRGPLLGGSRARETHRGRTGHDSPMLLAAGSAGFDDGHGEIWAAHLAYSGDAVYRTDVLPETPVLIGGGALLAAGEVSLAPGERYEAPELVFVFSDRGLNGVRDRLHRSLRARPQHPRTPRPVTLNTWEAVYFDHDLDRLTDLARIAAEIGVERFVLDDGWFRGRRDDRAGLGDWQVDADVWPAGLEPIVSVVRDLGLQFGLWFEPEMVNLESDLARRHPDWLLQPIDEGVRSWRHQYVLDVARDDVFSYLLDALSALVASHGIDYIKWDQNRDVIAAVHTGRSGVLAHTRAVYALIDALKQRHPGLEIESCASGGARVDLGILARTDRVWASDTNDPIERLAIQRWTELLLPPELVGSHVGPTTAHTTHRTSALPFRIAASLVESFGIEWDLTRRSAEELETLRAGIAAYRRLRSVLHTGSLRHGDGDDPGLDVTSVVATDAARAVVRVARVASAERALPPLLRVEGLDADRRYRVRPVPELAVPGGLEVAPPPWLEHGEVVLTGATLAALGVRVPLIGPGEALVLELDAL